MQMARDEKRVCLRNKNVTVRAKQAGKVSYTELLMEQHASFYFLF